MQIGRSLTEIQNKLLGSIIGNPDIVKALVINDEDFLNITPTSEQQYLIDNTSDLIRTRVFPYMKKLTPEIRDRTLIFTKYTNFEKRNSYFKTGEIYVFVLVPVAYEKTTEGIRYNYIIDKIDETFKSCNIGEFEFKERGDIDVDKEYLGHYIKFNMIDFYGW